MSCLKKDLFTATNKEVLECEGYRNVLWNDSEGINSKHGRKETVVTFQDLRFI